MHYQTALKLIIMPLNTTSELLIPRSQKILPCRINTAPFLAIPTVPGITYTMGGIVTNEKGQVMSNNNAVIPGLSAAGATTGGLEGGEQAAYIGGLMKSGVFGMIAAEEAANQIGKSDVGNYKKIDKESSIKSKNNEGYPAYAEKRGLADFPILRFFVKHGIAVSFLLGFVALVKLCIVAAWLF